MEVFSYSFFLIWAITLIAFFVAKRWQWQILTISSIVFYCLAIKKFPFVLLYVWLVTYFAAIIIERTNQEKKFWVLMFTVATCIAALVLGKTTGLVALLGNSYFTLKALGYLIDIYREEKRECSIIKYLLYLVYWPSIMEGPFNRIRDFEQQFKTITEFDYIKFVHGIQRFIWGTFKKLVIAERLELIITTIFSDISGKGGKYVLLGIVMYAIQIYADFSGFMDMMLGVSESLGIELPENFKQPYFAKGIPDFWRRWHITLGLWFRDYVMFPYTSNHIVKKISKYWRKRNKSVGKLIPLLTGTCIVWVLTGLWHGFGWNYLVWGGYYAVLMCLSQVYNEVHNIKKNRYLDFFRIIRTDVLVLIADSIICVQGLPNVLKLWKEILFDFCGDGNFKLLSGTGLVLKDVVLLIIGCILILVISVLKEKNISILSRIDALAIPLRWGIWYVLIYVILIYGLYNTQYDASQFLYMQF